MNPEIFTFTTPDPVGVMLGTGMLRFRSKFGINGLGKEPYAERLDLLAVDTHTPGKGQFRSFIVACKEKYKTICVWEVHNPWLGPVLERYGFKPETEITGWGEPVSGYRWDQFETTEAHEILEMAKSGVLRRGERDSSSREAGNN